MCADSGVVVVSLKKSHVEVGFAPCLYGDWMLTYMEYIFLLRNCKCAGLLIDRAEKQFGWQHPLSFVILHRMCCMAELTSD